MIAQVSNYVLGSVGYAALIGLYIWIDRTRVANKTFETEQKHNNIEHENIRKYIEDAEERSEQRHKELRKDLTEVKDLIRNNGHSKPRIRT